jgi:hypothetical protein
MVLDLPTQCLPEGILKFLTSCLLREEKRIGEEKGRKEIEGRSHNYDIEEWRSNRKSLVEIIGLQ